MIMQVQNKDAEFKLRFIWVELPVRFQRFHAWKLIETFPAFIQLRRLYLC